MVSVYREQDIAKPCNPFRITDLMVFDDKALQHVLTHEGFALSGDQLARSVRSAPRPLARRIYRFLPVQQRLLFKQALCQPISDQEAELAREQVLDALFWELTYWKTPQLYEELIEGEALHPEIFQRLEPEIRGKVILDAGAGSGRATFECLCCGASLIYAVEPSPGLLRIMQQKLAQQADTIRIMPCRGRFDALPLEENSIDISLSCSAFTALPGQGGEAGLVELQRVTRPGGKIILIWPRIEDRDWLLDHGFQYISIPLEQEMQVHFRSWQSALLCARRFYAHNRAVLHYLLNCREASVPFSVLGLNPPHEYCWLDIKKDC
jgi:ubiquinone/menaquinone biosynthesis C-methylase UbiE